MKKVVLPVFIFTIFLMGILFLNGSFTSPQVEEQIKLPENVSAIINQSCYGCHNTDSKNEDAREEFDFKTFNELGKVRKITKLKEFSELVEEREMPPKQFLEKNPDKALTDEQIAILSGWAKKEIKTLIGN